APAGEAGGAPAGPPAPEAGHVTLEVTAGNAVGTVIEIDDELPIGRLADGVGRLADDIEISRRHARIFRTDGGRYAVEDLVSTNGTYVNGRRIVDVTPLEVGDWMDIGTSTLVVRVCVPGPPTALPEAPELVEVPAERPPLAPAADELPPTEQVASAPSEPTELEVTGAIEATPGLSLRLEIDLDAKVVRIHLDEDSEPVTLVHRDGRWRARSAG
ncbi:MAG: FHA domain-containing protein, partial [Solirubrobacteraceae bacterium]